MSNLENQDLKHFEKINILVVKVNDASHIYHFQRESM